MSSAVRWSEVTAIFGGTFDPPHRGHRQAVRGLFQEPGVRRVLILPSASPPQKTPITEASHRLRMTELCFAGLSDVAIDQREFKRSAASDTPSYAIDTLLELRQEIPNLAFVVGADQLEKLHTWHRFPELLSVSNWIALARQPDGEKVARETLAQWEGSGILRREVASERGLGDWSTPSGTRLRLCPTPAQPLSSREVRETLARETSPQVLEKALESQLQPQVLSYLMEHRLYGMKQHGIQ